MTTKTLAYLSAVSLIIVTSLFLTAFNRNEIVSTDNPIHEQETLLSLDAKGDKVERSVRVPSSMIFAEEKVPLDELEIRERLDRELIVTKYFHSSTILFLKRANRWFPVIEPILAEQGVPDDFKYIAQSESGLENAVSPMNAVGFWQFRELAAKEFGLEVNDEVDERYHVEKSTVAACQYLKQLKDKFGSWTMAMAAYNYGPSKVATQIERQGQNEYWDLLLPSETSRYVFRVIAFKMVYENPLQFGFLLEEDQLYPPLNYSTELVNGEIENWKDFCDEKNITYKTLKWYNPWLRENHLKNPKGKSYEIKLPI